MTEWYYDEEKTVRILIPYSLQRLKKPSCKHDRSFTLKGFFDILALNVSYFLF